MTMQKLRAFLTHFDRSDIRPAVFYLGLVLMCYGSETLQDGSGFAVVGLLLVLYVRPLKGWL